VIYRHTHAVFSTKDRRPSLHSEEIRIEISAYMAGTLNAAPVEGRDCQRLHFQLGRISPRFSYREEIRKLLKRHRLAFEERFLWE
jgi:hypothetical protein